ncbi:MFS transporter [Aneurinibacillus tyrosinisolvens]|uniref:MFS transporter n=1 Tax=Aneurinibacillus tyrosinisolvens TaxID=1443435 RepID=UPI000AE70869|nr:MFS transporter [Aneurinibacillus tyrosinisolvens]
MLSTASLKAYNYFYFSLLAVFISFLPVYLSSQGVSTARIGVLLGTGSFIGILSQPLWGMISDKYKTIKKVLGITLGFSLCTGFVLFQSIQFLSLFLFVILMYFFFLPTDPLTESLNYRMAETTGVSFGSIRTFGAAGYASTSLIVGFLSDYFGLGSLAYIFLSYGAITLLICLTLPDAPAAGKPVLLKNLKRFFSEPKTVWFFLFILITAIPHRMNDMFLGIYIQAAGGTPGLVGQAWFYAAVSEVVFFLRSAFVFCVKEMKSS